MKKIFFLIFVLLLCGCGKQDELPITDEKSELIEPE